jgi:hypothetical protein
MIRSALFTDFYELTMAQGYFNYGMRGQVVFDMFFRRQPFGGGFSVFAGLGPLLETLENFRFEKDDIEYLKSLGCSRMIFSPISQVSASRGMFMPFRRARSSFPRTARQGTREPYRGPDHRGYAPQYTQFSDPHSY